MMSRKSLVRGAVAGLALLSAAAAPAAAQAGTSVIVFAGAAVPTGDAGNALSTGFVLGGGFQFQPALVPIGLRFDGGFIQHDIKDFDNKTNVWNITGNAVMNLAADNPLYLLGGLGFYSTSVSGSNSSSVTKTGFNLGAGFRLPLMGFGTFLEARYHHLFDSNYRVLPIVFGVSF
jgi:hypothetical protein